MPSVFFRFGGFDVPMYYDLHANCAAPFLRMDLRTLKFALFRFRWL
jgi:hypothetical protein